MSAPQLCLPFKAVRSACGNSAELLGHSDPKITLGIYTGFRDEEIQEAGKLIKAH